MKIGWFGKILIAFIAVVIIDLLVMQDKEFEYRWWLFGAWILLLTGIFIGLIWKKIRISIKEFSKGKVDWLLILTLGLALMTRFVFLDNYPFPSIGDELRDGGLDAMRIATGELKNIFAYGRYESHGLIIPTFNSFFYHIFGNSDLTYKVPAALIGSLDILVVYFIAKRFIHSRSGLIAALIMIAMPLHLYYSRTETVVIFSSLITSLLLLSLLFFVEKNSKNRLFAAVIMIGFALNFHGSAKAAAGISGIVVGMIVLYRYLNRGGLVKQFPELIGSVLVIIMGLIIGFGPRLVFSPPQTIFQTRSLILAEDLVKKEEIENPTWQDEAGLMCKKYEQSVLVYFATPAHSHFASEAPILNFLVGPFFILGLITIFVEPNKRKGVIVLFALLLPLTNSAITECLNCDHRLAPLFPFAALISTYGFMMFYDKALKRVFNKDESIPMMVIMILAGVLNFYPLTDFYVSQIANDNMFRVGRTGLYQSFMAQYAVERLQELDYQGDICVMGNKTNIEYMQLAHIREMFNYYLPLVNFEYSVKEAMPQKTLYIGLGCDNDAAMLSSYDSIDYCKEWKPFLCPFEENYPFKIYYDPRLQ
jgi:hypothetical protein